MTTTANLALPYLTGAQAQKHFWHDEALRILDTLVQLAVLDRDLNAPPASPDEGERWIVKAAPAPTGVWSGRGNHVAAWQDGGWQFSEPRIGWIAFVADEGTLVTWNGSAWGDFFATVTAIQNLALLGVGATADATNPFSAKLNNALWAAKTVAEGGDGSLRYKMSKEGAADTLSLLLQTGFSGRAEIGLTGDDDLHVKVSPDGSTWLDSLLIARATGKVSFPQGAVGVRPALTADRTYYVRTDGSDNNDGLSNTAGGAFATIQKAVDVVYGTLDLGGHNVTIQLADGTYTAGVVQNSQQVGAGAVTIQGNAGAPANVLVSTTAAACFTFRNGAAVTIKDLEVRTATSGTGLAASTDAVISFANLVFGACAHFHIRADDGGRISAIGDYAINGGCTNHWNAVGAGALIRVQSRTITLTGTPIFATFAQAQINSSMVVNGNTFAGGATGTRYSISSNAVVYTNGDSATYLPGDAAGATASGGQYV